MLNVGPVAWSSTLAKIVALSTCEAEVSAAVVACREAIHFKGMLVEMGLFDAKQPLQIAEDNSACIAQAQVIGLRHVRAAKQYEVRLRFLQQLVVDKDVNFVYCPTKSQLADHFTKPQDEATFMKMRDAMKVPVGIGGSACLKSMENARRSSLPQSRMSQGCDFLLVDDRCV